MKAQQTGIGVWFAVVAALAIVAGGCEGAGAAQGGTGGLVGKLGSSLGAFKKGDSISLNGAGQERPGDDGGVPGDDGPSGDDGASGGTGAGCQRACDVVIGCFVQECPAVGTPSADDLRGAVAECVDACDDAVDAADAAEIAALSCSDIWSALTAEDDSLEELCGASGGFDDGGFDDDGYDDGGFDDGGFDDGGFDDGGFDDGGFDDGGF
jgi:hypothetical protein